LEDEPPLLDELLLEDELDELLEELLDDELDELEDELLEDEPPELVSEITVAEYGANELVKVAPATAIPEVTTSVAPLPPGLAASSCVLP
jgi:hypothetical protein